MNSHPNTQKHLYAKQEAGLGFLSEEFDFLGEDFEFLSGDFQFLSELFEIPTGN